MQVLVTGASGLVGRAVTRALEAQGHGVRRLGRPSKAKRKGLDVATWEPTQGRLDPRALDGIEAVVHLAGESLVGLWTTRKKRAIRESRIMGTTLLCESMAACSRPPAVLISASAVGYYGDRADTLLTEESESGTGFLAETCLEWEGATAAASQAGVRVVRLREGVVLSRAGGMLPRLLPLFRAGLGARLGSGEQYLSWITREDLVRVILTMLQDQTFEGPVNAVAPQAVTNSEFTLALAKSLHRPAPWRIPESLLRLFLGELAEETLLGSGRVLPQKLLAKGFSFGHPLLADALPHVLHQHGDSPPHRNG